MIHLHTDEPLLLSPDWTGTHIACRVKAYGTKEHFAPFYTDENQNVASLLDGNMVLHGEQIDAEEWASFLMFQSDVHSVCADLPVAEKLAKYMQKPFFSKKVMCLHNALEEPDITVISPSPRQIYPLLSAVFKDTVPPFEGWYVDVSHRIRHGICKTAGILCEETLISTAMTVAESDAAAIIGAVATSEKHRKQGLARQCLRKLVAEIHAENPKKIIMIAPKNDSAEQLYAKMGFVVCGEIGQIEMV